MGEPGYETGYRDGGNAAYQDWVVVLNEFTPLGDDFDYTPSNVAAVIREMAELLAELDRTLPVEGLHQSGLATTMGNIRALLSRIRGADNTRDQYEPSQDEDDMLDPQGDV